MSDEETAFSREEDESEAAVRWRRALLRLSGTFMAAANHRSDLSPILLGALHSALEKLLIYGDEGDLMALEEWLAEEHDGAAASPIDPRAEKRSGLDRRSGERRSGEERRHAQ